MTDEREPTPRADEPRADEPRADEARPTGREAIDEREARLLERRARHYARRQEEESGESLEVLAFDRGETRYALPLDGLREVRPLRGFCRLPGVSAVVPGVFAYRGEILSLHDLESFHSSGSSQRSGDWAVVVEVAGRRLALLADEVHGVMEIFRAEIAPTPVTLSRHAGFFQGLLEHETLLVEPAALFDTPGFFRAV